MFYCAIIYRWIDYHLNDISVINDMLLFDVAYICSMKALNVYTVTAAIADPVRLSAMMYLIRGSASVSEMVTHLEVSQSNLSNHLSVLKNAGLIKSTPAGRQKIYELASPEAAQLIELLLTLQPISHKKEKEIKPIQSARTCYDHLAGKLGVAVFNALVNQGAICFLNNGRSDKSLIAKAMVLGPNADSVFGRLGVKLPLTKSSNRKFAYGCTDWTEKVPHLAGALGAALCDAFFTQHWIVRNTGTRCVTMTTQGKQAMKELLGLDIE